MSCAPWGTAIAACDPDFRGSWKLNEKRSDIRNAPRPHAAHLTIKPHGEGPHCSLEVLENESGATWHVSTGDKENRDRFDDGTMNTKAKWEGSALLINSLVNGKTRSYTRMDRWRLSRDGATLRIVNTIVDRRGEIESVLVYERQAVP